MVKQKSPLFVIVFSMKLTKIRLLNMLAVTIWETWIDADFNTMHGQEPELYPDSGRSCFEYILIFDEFSSFGNFKSSKRSALTIHVLSMMAYPMLWRLWLLWKAWLTPCSRYCLLQSDNVEIGELKSILFTVISTTIYSIHVLNTRKIEIFKLKL